MNRNPTNREGPRRVPEGETMVTPSDSDRATLLQDVLALKQHPEKLSWQDVEEMERRLVPFLPSQPEPIVVPEQQPQGRRLKPSTWFKNRGLPAVKPQLLSSTSARAGVVPLSTVPEGLIEWIWKPYIPRGAVTLVDGDPASGKSWLTLAIAAPITKGTKMPFGAPPVPGGPQRVLVLSKEDDPGKVMKRRARAVGANDANLLVFEVDTPRSKVKLNDEGIAWINDMITEHNPALVIIDPLVSFTGKDLDMNRSNEVRDMMDPLAELASRHNIGMLVVRHLRKGAGKAIHAGQGSMDYVAGARSQLTVARPDEDGPSIMAHGKDSWAKKGRALSYEIIGDGERFNWIGPVDITADELANEDHGKRRRDIEVAKDFLREALARGPIPSEALLEGAKANGISERTLKRARRVLGVVSTQPPGGAGWVSQLPEGPDQGRGPRRAGGQGRGPIIP